MGDRADKTLLKNVRDKIQSIDTDDLRMNQQSLAECCLLYTSRLSQANCRKSSEEYAGYASDYKQ